MINYIFFYGKILLLKLFYNKSICKAYKTQKSKYQIWKNQKIY